MNAPSEITGTITTHNAATQAAATDVADKSQMVEERHLNIMSCFNAMSLYIITNYHPASGR